MGLTGGPTTCKTHRTAGIAIHRASFAFGFTSAYWHMGYCIKNKVEKSGPKIQATISHG
jgi:hypothetical protein